MKIYSTRLFAALAAGLLFSASANGQAPNHHDNVIVLLDTSGSMNKRFRGGNITRLQAAKTALKTAIAKVPSSTQIGVLRFAKKYGPQAWIHPLGARENEKLFNAIDGQSANGNTPLGEYIKIAADRLLEVRQEQFGYGTYRLLIVTDGQASDRQLMERFTPEVMARGITMDVIGVDMKGDHTLATRVHSYRRADDPAALRTAVADIFAEVSGDQTDDANTQESFELLAAIPADLASAMLVALSKSGNHPIGTKRRKAAPVPTQSAEAPPSGSQNTRPGDGRFPAVIIMLLVAIGIVFAKFIGRK